MLRAILPLCLGLLVWAALPAQAEDGDAEALRERVAELETQASLLRRTLDLALEQNRQLAESRELATTLMETTREVAAQQARNAKLQRETLEAQLENAGLRRQWLELQLKQAVESLERERAEVATYHGALFAQLGKPAAQVLAARLHEDPVAHATRIAPLLAAMGPKAAGVLPLLEKILAGLDPKHTSARARLKDAIAAVRAR